MLLSGCLQEESFSSIPCCRAQQDPTWAPPAAAPQSNGPFWALHVILLFAPIPDSAELQGMVHQCFQAQ